MTKSSRKGYNPNPLLGYHWLGQFQNCTAQSASGRLIVDDAEELERLLVQAAAVAQTNVIGVIRKQFPPQGATAIIGLSESHESAHTWPEYNQTVLYDIFSCNLHTPGRKVLDYLAAQLGAGEYVFSKLARRARTVDIIIDNQRVRIKK